ncbi:MFS transporter [Salsipaludibacter albus]|uniref:MFS transporter n=1 Tax=Salsipaludibacter albus TaxID=2849650 RepID=UPI001EE42288|nr:MFS transporter [Salsipaludibacter albus]
MADPAAHDPAAVARVSGPASLSLEERAGRLALAAVVLGSAAVFLDSTVITVALPAIATDLGADVADQQWVANSYMVTLSALLLFGGRLGDRFGRRRMYLWGLGAFVVTAGLAAFAPTIEVLIAARALQGVGGALLTPGSLSIIQASFRRHDRARAIGLWTALSGATTAGGPVAGGWLTDQFGWRSVFVLLVVLGIGAFVLAVRAVPESRDRAAAGRVDVAGAVLAGVALAALSWGLTTAGDRGGFPPEVLAAIGVAIVAVVAFVATERRVQDPLLPPELGANRPLVVVNGLTFVVYGALGGMSFLLTLYLQNALGYSAAAAGAASLPMIVLMVVGSPRMGEVARRSGPRRPLVAGSVLMAVGMLLLSFLSPGDSYLVGVLPGVAVFGVGLMFLVAPVTASALAVVDDDHAGLASGLNNAVARTAQLLVVAVLPLAVGLSGDDFADPATFRVGYALALRLTAGLAAVGAVIAFTLLDDDTIDLGRDD